ncbi:hypothetical protein [Ferrimonas marina]|nr:hypothetical protein [Ferrimonas marina]
MDKEHLVRNFVERTGAPEREARAMVEAILQVMAARQLTLPKPRPSSLVASPQPMFNDIALIIRDTRTQVRDIHNLIQKMRSDLDSINRKLNAILILTLVNTLLLLFQQ